MPPKKVEAERPKKNPRHSSCKNTREKLFSFDFLHANRSSSAEKHKTEKKTDKDENRQKKTPQKPKNRPFFCLTLRQKLENTKSVLKHPPSTLPRPSPDPPATLPRPFRDPPTLPTLPLTVTRSFLASLRFSSKLLQFRVFSRTWSQLCSGNQNLLQFPFRSRGSEDAFSNFCKVGGFAIHSGENCRDWWVERLMQL